MKFFICPRRYRGRFWKRRTWIQSPRLSFYLFFFCSAVLLYCCTIVHTWWVGGSLVDGFFCCTMLYCCAHKKTTFTIFHISIFIIKSMETVHGCGVAATAYYNLYSCSSGKLESGYDFLGKAKVLSRAVNQRIWLDTVFPKHCGQRGKYH